MMLIFIGNLPQIVADDGPDVLPSMPLDLTATPGNGNVLLTWSPPQYSNGSSVQEYWIYRNSTGEMNIVTTLGNVTNYLDIGLANGREYRYAIRAINQQGAGNLSHEVAVTPRTVPFAPLNPRAQPGDRFLNITWDVPTWNGGSNITGYNIYEVGTSGPLGSSSETYFIHSLLDPLSQHTYLVAALNAAGEGPTSVLFTGRADTTPGVPANITVTGGVNNVTLTWDVPAGNGGSGPSGYRIYRGDAIDNMSLLLALGPEMNSYTDHGLLENTIYCYGVSSFNLVGESEPTVPIWAGVLGRAHVYITSVIEGDRNVELFWQVDDQWSSQVIRYWIYRGDDIGNLTLLRNNLTVPHYTDLGLSNGHEYFYRLAAETPAGLGWSQNVSAIPHRSPFSPLWLNATGNDGYIVLDWQPPEDDGGSAVLGYKVYMGPHGQAPSYLAEVKKTTFTCAGLVSGLIYDFQVSAVNSAGEGDLSDVVEEMCGEVPSTPLNIISTSGQSYVKVTWDPPAYPGTVPVQMYEVRRNDGQNNLTLTLRDRSWNDTSVSNGMSYQYMVRAINQVGEGPWSDTVEGTPDWTGGPPYAPRNLTASAGPDHISLSWDQPYDGGHDISGYVVYRGFDPDLMFYLTTVYDEAYNDTNLPLGSTYYYKVAAKNIVGEGPGSNVVNATTVAPIKEEKSDLWTILLTKAVPLSTLMILAVIGISLLIGNKLVKRKGKEQNKRTKKDQGKGKRTSAAKRPTPPETEKQVKGKEKDKGGRWD